MNLISYSDEKMEEGFGIRSLSQQSPLNSCGSSFYSSFNRVEIGASTKTHSHFEIETFFISRGRAIAYVNNKKIYLNQNDLLIIHPFEKHRIENVGEEALEFFSAYSRSSQRYNDNKNTLILSAPPTPNGSLHLGHLSGPYLSADVLKRYLSLQGRNVKHFSGTDDHQSYTYKMSEEIGLSQEELVEHFRESIAVDLARGAVELDCFLSPIKNEKYQTFIQEKFDVLKSNHAVSMRKIALPFNKDYQYEAFLEGKCPECEEPTIGQCCERCGFSGEALDFNDQNLKFYKGLSLDLSSFRAFLQDYHLELGLTGEVAKRAKKWRDNLGTFTLTHPKSHGIGGIHVWCEMAIAILFQRKVFKQDLGELIYCFGIDNAYYYLILIPAILKLLGEELQLPNRVVINQFYHLDNEKFSTSRDHAIWIKDVKTKEIDKLRFYLALTRSEKTTGNYQEEDFWSFSRELDKKINRLHMLEKKEGVHLGIESREKQSYYKRLTKEILKLEEFMDSDFSLNMYSKQALEILDGFLAYIEFSDEPVARAQIFIPLIKMILYPLMPNTFNSADFDSLWSLDLRKEKEYA